MTKEHPCLTTAKQMTEEDEASLLWRGHWLYRVYVEEILRFEGSYRACRWALNAFSSKPYELVDITGKSLVSNR